MLQLCIFPDDVKGIHLVRIPGNFPGIQTVQNLQGHCIYVLRGKREFLRPHSRSGESWRAEVARPSFGLCDPYQVGEIGACQRWSRSVARRHKLRSQEQKLTLLIRTSVDREAFLRELLRRQYLLLASTTQEHRFQPEQMHHDAAVDIVEIIRSLVERFVIIWRAMVMNEEYPSETLISEFIGQVHVDRPQRRHSDGITSEKYRLSANCVGGIIAQRNLRKQDDCPAGSGDDGLRQFAYIGIIGIAVRIRREVRTVFFQNAARNQDHSLLKI